MSTPLGTPSREPAPRGLSSSPPLPLGGPIAFGAWAIGGEWGAPVDDDVARRTIERALELGITGFDTAPTYGSGRSEALLGDVLPPYRDRVLLVDQLADLGLLEET